MGDGTGTFGGISKSQSGKIQFHHEHVVYDGSSMNGFPLGIADSEQDMPGIKPGPLGPGFSFDLLSITLDNHSSTKLLSLSLLLLVYLYLILVEGYMCPD